VIFDIVEYIIMEWTIPNKNRIYRRVLILTKRSRVLVTSLHSSIGQERTPGKTKQGCQGRLRGRQYWELFAVVNNKHCLIHLTNLTG